MYDQFDDKLSGRIKDVFENFEDDTADYGWTELRKRFPGEEKRRAIPIWWWQSAAAVLLITLGTFAYYWRDSEKVYLTGKNLKPHTESEMVQKAVPSDYPDTRPLKELNAAGTEAALISRARHNGTAKARYHTISGEDIHQQPAFTTPEPNAVSDSSSAKFKELASSLAFQEEQRVVSVTSEQEKPAATVINESSSNALERAVVADMLMQRNNSQASALASIEQTPDAPKKESKKSRQLTIGIFAGSYFNYSDGSESGMNTGVGLSSEISISKRLKISTGISLAQNTLKYSDAIPQSAAADFKSVAASFDDANTTLKSEMASMVPAIQTTYNINNYNASLLGLDIPVNLKYTVLQSQNELYVSAGLSSNFFIEESYSYSYELNRGAGSTTSTQEDNNATSKFQNFDLARILNVSIGFGHPVGKQSRLSFEPFVKYPLGGQGARDLRFGAAGMNLKLNFGM
ncbi:hypothetical protein [Desertivirga xinjiangensis]|uniref:hypothetical protein n=1 Tax=Desertivirga xinjiangensis TaxID=539206 RepID=UPI0021093E3D|nr:hypothetical protein [Pedobacter xinjiangensis]